jgi:hypothetical protein
MDRPTSTDGSANVFQPPAFGASQRRRKIGLLLLALSMVSCAGQQVETYRDKNVVAKEENPPGFPFNVHGSKTTYLIVNGKTYKGVRGTPPYYLDIPQLNSILFVTEERNGKVTFHLANLQTKKEIAIDGDESGFGGHIGSKKKPGEIMSDYVEKVEPPRVLIAKRSLNWTEITTLNVDSKKVERLDTFFYDQNDQITNHLVRTPGNGKE